MPAPTHNQPEYSVSEISGALKRMVEDSFGYVRVRGELSGFKRAASGHLYMDLKDDKAVLNGVCWKGNAARLSFKPEDGLEVICTGKLSTYPGRSNYQLIIESMEPAGAGALMALLEKRKKDLAAEGLFAPERKQSLPFMPQHIGVVTSPTGAVIRDILHRLSDRFPVYVQVWPVRVQGEGAAEEIAAAITGFAALPEPPELLIVARGGGSLEDLWCFNEEVVVRAAAVCPIPIISAVGHETDTTLMDYVADKRAPTPTAAAEIAVPVRHEWMLTLQEWHQRLNQTMHRQLSQRKERTEGLARGIPSPAQLLQYASQRLDDWAERLGRVLPGYVQQREQQLKHLTMRLSPVSLQRQIRYGHEKMLQLETQLNRSILRSITQREQQLTLPASLLENLNYTQVLKRGFAIVKSKDGQLITNASTASTHAELELVFHDDSVRVISKTPKPKKKKNEASPQQDSLFDA